MARDVGAHILCDGGDGCQEEVLSGHKVPVLNYGREGFSRAKPQRLTRIAVAGFQPGWEMLRSRRELWGALPALLQIQPAIYNHLAFACVCAYMQKCLCAYPCRYLCMHVCTLMQMTELDIRYLLQSLFTLFFETEALPSAKDR